MDFLDSAPLPRPYYKSPRDIADSSEWDIVIIGGGTSGCVLASRLSERPDLKVLLLEAGQSASANIWSRIPLLWSKTVGTPRNWNFSTVTQKHAGNRPAFWPLAKLMGGCSSVNVMMFHTCSPEDFNEWSSSSQDGASQWSYEKIAPYYKKFEKFHEDTNHEYMVDKKNRGLEGKVATGFLGKVHSPWDTAFGRGATAVGIQAVDDLNAPGSTLGYSQIQTYVGPNGERSSSETAYLTEDVLQRPNLTVVAGAYVTKIVFESADGGKKKVTSIEFADRQNGDKRHTVKVRKEAVLSAGTTHSPAILMYSGVGPAAHLKSHNIPVIIDLPGVGQGLLDHPRVDVMFGIKHGSFSYLAPNSGWSNWLKSQYAALQWRLFGAGDLQSNGVESAAFLRSDDPKLFPPEEFPRPIEDTTAGPNSPDIELFAAPFNVKRSEYTAPNKSLGCMVAGLLRPTSVGEITLASNNPLDDPLIDPNFLETQHDIDVLVRGLRLLLKIAKTPDIRDEIDWTDDDVMFDNNLDKASDAELEKLIRERIQSMFHPTSSVRMAPLEEKGCVDYYLKLYGATNLRVVDDSILPNIVSGHTAAVAFALGEKASDLIKEQWA